jgi:hypothetical protein
MVEETSGQKSLVEQILDEMFTIIEGREEFDIPTIEKLKQLVISGSLTKAKQVAEVIKSASEGAS